jgi:hypothetical protein
LKMEIIQKKIYLYMKKWLQDLCLEILMLVETQLK